MTQSPVGRSREGYTARIEYEQSEAKTVGSVNARAATDAGFTGAVTAVTADEAIATAMDGDAFRIGEKDSFPATLTCHDANTEISWVSFGHEQVRVSSCTDDAIPAAIETLADTMPAPARGVMATGG